MKRMIVRLVAFTFVLSMAAALISSWGSGVPVTWSAAGTAAPDALSAAQSSRVVSFFPNWAISVGGLADIVPEGFFERDEAAAIQDKNEGQVVVAGTAIFEPDGSGTLRGDIVVMEVDIIGNVTWKVWYRDSPTSLNEAETMIKAKDGGYYVLGSISDDGYSNFRSLVMKIAADGAVLWVRAYRLSPAEAVGGSARGIAELSNGECVVASQTGDGVYWLFRLDVSGRVVWSSAWQAAAGWTGYSESGLRSISATPDGGFVIAGHTLEGRAEVLKFDAAGGLQWHKSYIEVPRSGYHMASEAYVILASSDGGYIMSGSTRYAAMDMSGGSNEGWLCKLDGAGEIVWQKGYPNINSVTTATDGGYLATDPFLLKLDGSGNIQWHKKLTDFAFVAAKDFEGGYLAAGSFSSGEGSSYKLGLAGLSGPEPLYSFCGRLEDASLNERSTSLHVVPPTFLRSTRPLTQAFIRAYSSVAGTGQAEVICTSLPPLPLMKK